MTFLLIYMYIFFLNCRIHDHICTCREFCKRIDPDLPFCYYTSSDRYTEEELSSFDILPGSSGSSGSDHTYTEQLGRLHKPKRNTREDASLIVAGKCFLPPRGSKSIRSRMYTPVIGLPPLPPDQSVEGINIPE